MTRDEAAEIVDKTIARKIYCDRYQSGSLDRPYWEGERLGKFSLVKIDEGTFGEIRIFSMEYTPEERERSIDWLLATKEVEELCLEARS